MLELKTPAELIDKLVENIEMTRKRKKLRQTDLCKKADIPRSTYQKLIHGKQINLMGLIKIMYALNMKTNLQGLVHYDEITSLDDIRNAARDNTPQRVRK